MISEKDARELKTNISALIESYNVEISKKQNEIEESKKKLYVLQAKLSLINKVLNDE
jgi:hypothetical protein